jgi:hypothetical protein
MFRLADLYLDAANLEFEKSLEAGMAQVAAAENETPVDGEAPADGELPADDTEMQATADYSKSLALWTDIIQRFPEYRQRPGTLYLLGYYLKQTGEDR